MTTLLTTQTGRPLNVHPGTHQAHHNWITDIVHWIVHAASSGFGWWAGRHAAEQLGIAGIAVLALAAGALWLISRHRPLTRSRFAPPTCKHPSSLTTTSDSKD